MQKTRERKTEGGRLGEEREMYCGCDRMIVIATTLSGLRADLAGLPRVDRCSQPWALRQNPFGIQGPRSGHQSSWSGQPHDPWYGDYFRLPREMGAARPA